MTDKIKELKKVEDHFLVAATELARASMGMREWDFPAYNVKVTIGDVISAAVLIRDERHELERDAAKEQFA